MPVLCTLPNFFRFVCYFVHLLLVLFFYKDSEQASKVANRFQNHLCLVMLITKHFTYNKPIGLVPTIISTTYDK